MRRRKTNRNNLKKKNAHLLQKVKRRKTIKEIFSLFTIKIHKNDIKMKRKENLNEKYNFARGNERLTLEGGREADKKHTKMRKCKEQKHKIFICKKLFLCEIFNWQ